VTRQDRSPLADTEVHALRSEAVGDEYTILIGHCGASRSVPGPVLFTGDAWANFGTAVETVRLLRLSESVPPMLVVAVAYRTQALPEIFMLRSRDFTPSVDPAYARTSDAAMMGGAGRFLAFLRDELKPWVEDTHGIDPSDSMYFGYSLGGLFATHVLLTEPTVFRRYGIGSPSLWWANGEPFDREAEYAKTHDDLPADVFFSIGEFETIPGRRRYVEQLPAGRRAKARAEDEADPPLDAVADATRMVEALRSRGYPRLKIEFEILPGEYHETAPPLTLSRALRRLFGAPR
jgi:hypothetical protein